MEGREILGNLDTHAKVLVATDARMASERNALEGVIVKVISAVILFEWMYFMRHRTSIQIKKS